MINIGSNNGRVAYGIKTFFVDVPEDIANLPKDCTPGSQAKVISDSSTYCLNSAGKWVKVNFHGNSGGGGGDSSGEQDITILS